MKISKKDLPKNKSSHSFNKKEDPKMVEMKIFEEKSN